MELKDLLTIILTSINLLMVSLFSVHSIIDRNRGKITRGKKVWLNTEVISKTKIDNHIMNLEAHLKSKLTLTDKCSKLDSEMILFFYESIDYIRMIDPRKYPEIKKNIMLAMDELMLTVIQTSNDLSDVEISKVVQGYRIKLIKNLFELGIEIDKKM